MKRLIVLFLLISSTAFPQAWKQLYSVPNKVTRFGIAVPKDVLIYEIDSSKIYRLTELRLPTDSMATAFRLNKAVAISGSSSASVDTTGWNIATKSDVPWYVASGAIKQKTSTDSVVPNYAITYANPIGYINSRSATFPVTNYARMYLNGNVGSTSIYNGYNGPSEFANSSISYTQTPSAGAVTWLYGNSGYGTYKYQMDVNGLYPSIYSTAGTYNQYLGIPTGPWNYAYLKKLHVSELVAGTASDSLLTTKDGEVKRIAAATFEPAISSGTTAQYWRGDKTWQTISSTPVDSIPFQRSASRGVTFLRNGTDKIAIGSTATPDSTLKVTGGVNVTGGLKVAGKVMAPTFIGGTAVGSGITYQSTTGNGTSTGIAHQFKGGNNGATTAITILNNGKIGIGTTNPLYALHVFGDAVLGSVTTLSGSAGQAAIDGSNSSGGYAGKFASTTGTAGYFSTSSSGTGIHVTSNTGYAAIFQKGNVGIGTTSPARLLHVKGRARIDTIPYSASPTLKVVAQDTTTGDIYRTTVSSGTTYTATSPMSVAGNDVHILSDTLTSWRTKMGQGAAAYDSILNQVPDTIHAGYGVVFTADQIILRHGVIVDTRPYKSYVALLTQTGTDDPVATVIENTLGFDFLWARSGDIGNYTTISHYDLGSAVPLPEGSFPDNKTTCSISQTTVAISEPLFAGIKRDNDMQIEIQTGNIGDKSDNVLQGHVVEIRIYN